MDSIDVTMASLAFLFGLALLWFQFRGWLNWPPEQKVPSERSRRGLRVALLVFAASMMAYAVLRLAHHFGLVSDSTVTMLGALFAVPFFASTLPLIWYRVKHGMG